MSRPRLVQGVKYLLSRPRFVHLTFSETVIDGRVVQERSERLLVSHRWFVICVCADEEVNTYMCKRVYESRTNANMPL